MTLLTRSCIITLHTISLTFHSTGQLLLTKDARSLAVEFPSVFTRLEELCNSKHNEKQMKQLNIMIEFERTICEQLKHVISMTSYSTLQIGGKSNFQKQNYFTLGLFISTKYSHLLLLPAAKRSSSCRVSVKKQLYSQTTFIKL